jgi:microcin C transport system substrate-binding protein
MSKLIVPLFIASIFLFGCGKPTEKNSDKAPSASVVEKSPQEILAGESDPIANPEAVKGGSFTTWGSSFPKSFNYWLDTNALSAQVAGLLFEPLVALHSTKNEPYGIVASKWSISDDKKTFTFHIDPQAQWSDGKPITAVDFQFYYDVMMNPKNPTSIFRVGLKRFSRPEVVDERTLKVTANEVHWNNFWEAAGLIAFPKHAWEKLDFKKINFEFPVVSGPYELSEVKKDRSATLKRRPNWWGLNKQYNQFKFNFDYIRYRFMEDRIKALEAFKKGDFDLYPVYTASIWAKMTEFDQVKKGWVVRQRVFNKEPIGFQGFAINLRRPIFQDIRVREALCHLLNRELMNEKLMFRQYFLLNSYYPDLYTDNRNPKVPLKGYDPVKARALLEEAGWKVGPNGILVKEGKQFEIVIPTDQSDLRHFNVYLEDLKKIGIKASIDQVSGSTMTKRMDNHDFDLHWDSWGAGRLRDPEAMWLSSTANEIASSNHAGVVDKKIDRFIETQKSEMSLDKRNEILKQIDQRLNEVVPYVFLWQSDNHRLLYWNKFGTPKYILDKFNREDAALVYWWLDPEKESALQKAMKSKESMPAASGDIHYQE